MHLGNVKFGPEWSSPVHELCLQKEPFGYVKNRRPNCVIVEKNKTAFSWTGSVPIFEGCFPL